jgi:peptidoglycan DL-endopeptidase CwlO
VGKVFPVGRKVVTVLRDETRLVRSNGAAKSTKGLRVSTQGRTRAVALGATAVLTLALGQAAQADPHQPTIPSRQQVDDAQQRVTSAEQSVGSIEAALADANQRLEDLDIAAEQASEAYNGALVAWHQSRSAATAAERRSSLARHNAEAARSRLAGYLVAADSSGSDLTSFSSALTAGGPHRLITEMTQNDTSTRALGASMQQWQATSELAKVYRAQSEAALRDAASAKKVADSARAAAASAVEAQQAAVVSIGTQRQSLLAQLAAARHISVALATQRQQGLEQRREERQREERRRELLALQRREERQQARAEAQQRREARERRRESGGSGSGGHSQHRRHHHQGPPPPPPPAPPPPPSGGNAQAAIDFAYAQLGEPYVWGAAGPDSWDCSGLTMGSWAAAGVTLPHYSVDQYYDTTPISYADIRPGDLIFWASDSSNPNTIFHVALYIGDGKMIQAPRTGENVQIQDVWYWESPDFFTRP